MQSLFDFFTNRGFMPHIHCYLDTPSLVWTMVVTDSLIGLAYIGISLTLWALIRRIKIEFSAVVLCFGVFIGACGATHFMEVYTLWIPIYWVSAAVKVITAIASVGTGIYLFRLRHAIVAMAESARLAETRRLDLESLTVSLEERITARTADLQSALEVRDGFFSVASHELRTPLTSLKMKTQMAMRGIGLDGTAAVSKTFVSDINDQVIRLSRLVEDMLDLARYRGGTLPMAFSEHDLTELVKATLQRLQPYIDSAGISLTTNFSTSLTLPFDKIRIEQVVGNLLVNATKYAPNSPLFVGITREADRARITIRDGGPGIALEDQERIFNQFERLTPKQHLGGLGVGLFLARAIVEAHHGKLSVESAPGAGTAFHVDLPLTQRPQMDESIHLGNSP